MLAVLFVFDDYLLYNQEVKSVRESGRNVALMFLLDMLVLLIWYMLALAAADTISAFLAYSALFFVCTSIWEFVFAAGSLGHRILWAGDLPIVFASGALAYVSCWLQAPFWVYLMVLLPVFVWWRWASWVDLWKS